MNFPSLSENSMTKHFLKNNTVCQLLCRPLCFLFLWVKMKFLTWCHLPLSWAVCASARFPVKLIFHKKNWHFTRILLAQSTLCQSGFYTLYPVLILMINKLDLMESKITEKDSLQQEGMWGINFPHIAVTAVGKVGMKRIGTEGRWQLIRW